MSDKALLTLRAQTSMHPGAGSGVGAIDMPVQRERHTGWPCIQGSSLKGILRDASRRKAVDKKTAASLEAADTSEEVVAVFGPTTANAADHAGALAVTDARILLFPVRSASGGFALVTCPGVLNRLGSDLAMASMKPTWTELPVPAPGDGTVAIATGAAPLWWQTPPAAHMALFEDLLLTECAADADAMDKLCTWLDASIVTGSGAPSTRLAIIHDDAFTHITRFCTEVVTRTRLDYQTKTVADKLLFSQEMLPAETVLYTVLLAQKPPSKSLTVADATAVISTVQGRLPSVLQIGGDETTGKGFCWQKMVIAPAPGSVQQ